MNKYIKSFLIYSLCAFGSIPLYAQERSLAQNPALNNLMHPQNYDHTEINKLGKVTKIGSGEKSMIFIPGISFGAESYTEFLEGYKKEYTIYAITLPGYGGTNALSVDESNVSNFAGTPWINSTVNGIEELIGKEGLTDVALISHWALGTQIALRIALNKPDKISKVILISGVAKSYFSNTPDMILWTLEQRKRYVASLSEQWFKTVTRKTWDDNNYMSYDYAINPLRGLFLWREAAEPDLHVQIRYLLEFYTTDITTELDALEVPVLVLQPTFNDASFYIDPTRPDYMKDLSIGSWKGVDHPLITFQPINETRLFMMYDRPEEVDKIITEFLTRDS